MLALKDVDKDALPAGDKATVPTSSFRSVSRDKMALRGAEEFLEPEIRGMDEG